MFRKILCILSAGIMLVSFAACNSDVNEQEESTQAETTTAFDEYVIAKEVYDKQAVELEELAIVDGTEYKLVELNGKKCIVALTQQGNCKVYYEFEKDFRILSEVNKRTNGSYIYFLENPESKTKRTLKVFYAKNASVVTFAGAPCSDMILLNVPESYEMYPYGFIAVGNELRVVDLKDASSSSYSRSLEQLGSFIETPEALFAQGKNGAYTYTSLEAVSRTHIQISVFNVDSRGNEELQAKFTFNPINGVAADVEDEE